MIVVNTYTHNGAFIYIPIEVSIEYTSMIYNDISKSLYTSYGSSHIIKQRFSRITKSKYTT